MTEAFTLKNSAMIFPDAGFDPTQDHFAVICADVPVGTIYRIDEDWIWSITLGMMGITSGRSASRREARQAFRAAWDERATRLGEDHVARALAVAKGRST